MNATAAQAMIARIFVSESSSFCSGERVRVTEVSIVAIWPISVSIPVAVTTTAAVPRVTAVFWKTMFERSPSPTSLPARTPASLATGALSPVSAASCVSSVAERTTRPSAGTMSPASSWIDVAGNDVDRRHECDAPVAHHLRLWHLHVREGVDALARLQLLARAEHEVEDDQECDEDSRRDLADEEACDGDADEHQVHRVAELLQGDRDDRGRHLALDLVRAVTREPRRRLGGRQPRGRVRVQLGQDVRCLTGVRRRCGRRRAGCDGGHHRHSPDTGRCAQPATALEARRAMAEPTGAPPRPTSRGGAAPSPRRPRPSSSRAARVACSGGSARGRGGPTSRRTEKSVSRSWTVPVPAKMKRWSRSPSQRKKPESANRRAKATVRIAFTFCPALKRPCGACRPRSQRRSSRSIDSISRQSVCEPPPVADDEDRDDRDRPGDARPRGGRS